MLAGKYFSHQAWPNPYNHVHHTIISLKQTVISALVQWNFFVDLVYFFDLKLKICREGIYWDLWRNKDSDAQFSIQSWSLVMTNFLDFAG